MFGCKHDWKVLSETKTESQLEQIKRLGLQVTKGGSLACERKLIQIITCQKCGQLKRFETDI